MSTLHKYKIPYIGIGYKYKKVMTDLEECKKLSGVIIANRHAEILDDGADKVYSRDLFGND